MGVVGFRVDASKHMWPQDIQGTIDRLVSPSSSSWFENELKHISRVSDLPEGGRPFFVHEVVSEF